MGLRQEHIVGLDVGTTKVCAVVARAASRGVEPLGVGVCPAKGVSKGRVVDPESATESARLALREAALMCGLEIREVYAGLDGGRLDVEGVEIVDRMRPPLAAAFAVLSAEELREGVCLVDVGGGTTEVVIFQGGAPAHAGIIRVGGQQITNDIAVGLRTTTGEAERLKLTHARARLTAAEADDRIEVPGVAGRPARRLSRGLLGEIVEARVDELLGLVRGELERAAAWTSPRAGLVLTGGSSLLPGLCELAEQVTGLPARLGLPSEGAVARLPLLRSPRYAGAIGLALYGAYRRGRDEAAQRGEEVSGTRAPEAATTEQAFASAHAARRTGSISA